MRVSPISVSPLSSTPPLSQFVQRLANAMAGGQASEAQAAQEVAEAPTEVTTERLRAALVTLGAAGNAQNLALAEAFSRLGLPLTLEALAEANTALARAPGASPRAYALAAAREMPTTPAGLLALTAAMGEGAIAPQEALSASLLQTLGLAADTALEPEALTAHLYLLAQGAGRSTENRIIAQRDNPSRAPVQDARTILLRLAQGSSDRGIQRGADALAAHIEGQQVINQITRRCDEGSEFFLAVPILIGEETALAEMLLGTWDDEQDASDLPPETPWLRATVRVATRRLGRVQVGFVGTLAGRLACRLGAEQPATVRLLSKHLGTLAAALAATGDWQIESVECETLADWTPLWHGGANLAAPRPCLDWRA